MKTKRKITIILKRSLDRYHYFYCDYGYNDVIGDDDDDEVGGDKKCNLDTSKFVSNKVTKIWHDWNSEVSEFKVYNAD